MIVPLGWKKKEFQYPNFQSMFESYKVTVMVTALSFCSYLFYQNTTSMEKNRVKTYPKYFLAFCVMNLTLIY